MKLETLLIALLVTLPAMAQEPKSPLLFETYEWDFGQINEVDGIVTHVFRFMNVSDETVQLDIISTSCGCTTTEYSTDPVTPGEYGEVTVHLSPARTEGKIFREVEIFTKGRKSYDHLSLFADVTPMPMGINELYPHELAGTIRTNNKRCNFGYVPQGTTATKAVAIANNGDKPVRLSVVTTGDRNGMTVSCPETIEPKQSANFYVTYTIPKGNDFYGMARDSIWIVADGAKSDVPFVVSALRIEQLDKSEGKPQPVMQIEPSYVDFGTKTPGRIFKQTITIANTGNADLIFRNVEACTGTATGLKSGTVIGPGKSVKVTVSISNSKYPHDTTMGSINLTTNDPTRPFRELRLQIDTK